MFDAPDTLNPWAMPLLCSQGLGSGQLGHLVVDFAVHVVRACVIAEPVLAAPDLFATLETLVKISYSLPAQAGLQLQQLVVEARRAKCGPCRTSCPLALARNLTHVFVSHSGSALLAMTRNVPEGLDKLVFLLVFLFREDTCATRQSYAVRLKHAVP